MNVTILSIFRNAAGPQIAAYFERVEVLSNLLAKRKPWTRLSLVLGYGDSTDGTGEELFEAAADSIGAHLLDVSHGGPEFGSIEHPQRFKQLAYCGNKLLDNVPDSADVVGIVESDLIWDAPALAGLIDHLVHVPAIAPMVMDGPESFYDVFSFRKGGARFSKEPPYHEWLETCCELVQVDSAGSVLFVRADLARKARLTDGEAIVGFCRNIYEHGGSIWLDTTLSVAHPPFGGEQPGQPATDSGRAQGLLRLRGG